MPGLPDDLNILKRAAISPAVDVLKHVYDAILKIPAFTLSDGTRATMDPYYSPEPNSDGQIECGFDVLLDNGNHLEFTVANTGWGKSFVQAKPKGSPRSR